MICVTHPSRWEVTRYRCECIRAALDGNTARLDWLQRNPPQFTRPAISESETGPLPF